MLPSALVLYLGVGACSGLLFTLSALSLDLSLSFYTDPLLLLTCALQMLQVLQNANLIILGRPSQGAIKGSEGLKNLSNAGSQALSLRDRLITWDLQPQPEPLLLPSQALLSQVFEPGQADQLLPLETKLLRESSYKRQQCFRILLKELEHIFQIGSCLGMKPETQAQALLP